MTERKLSVRSKASSVSSVGGPAVEKRTLRVKMVLLGSSGVGKSSLAIRFTKDEFRCTVPTVGSAYLTHLVCLYDTTLRFEIWDTAGQEKYHSVTPLYYRGAQAALVVYDITKRESFARAQLWLKELERQYFLGETAVALVGNKGDLDDLREVALQEGQTLAENKGLLFMETSAKSGNKHTRCGRAQETRGCSLSGGTLVWICTPHRRSTGQRPAVWLYERGAAAGETRPSPERSTADGNPLGGESELPAPVGRATRDLQPKYRHTASLPLPAGTGHLCGW
ncbi:ras-related protein Rab-17 isoform X1 [Amia ocellicauda]|uniref:ras-related protein Rab-17 isoform X1 n=1 Tax=Amia ocellicauda TaxID=2972642 RepID=UPI0034642F2C